MSKTQNEAIGIDLGTTFSCAAVCINDRIQIIPNQQGNRLTPSYVAFTDSERLIGKRAMNQAAKNPLNTIYNVKRLIGKNINDPYVQENMKRWPFIIKAGKDQKLKIVVNYKDQVKLFSPEEISAMVLEKIKNNAQTELGNSVKDAVITVPSYFNNDQRQATKNAGTIAGLNVLRIINESTAAAMAYGFDKMDKSFKQRKIVVFDLGGGTFDISLLNIDQGIFEILATAGNGQLGGEDFDQKLLEYCIQDFKNKTKINIQNNPRAMRKLRTQCQRAKRTLSSSLQATIQVDCLAESEDYSIVINRAKLEQICLPLFKLIIPPMEKIFKDSGVKKDEISEIVLVGGSSRIPKIIEMVRQFFGGKQPIRSINPDEAVAIGAAIHAATISAVNSKFNDMICIEVTSLSFGIQTAGGIMTVLIPRNTMFPHKKSQMFTTYSDTSAAVQVQVFQGQRQFTKDNHLVGRFNLNGIPPAPRGVPQIQVTFQIDENGILQVTAKELINNKIINVVMGPQSCCLSAEEVYKSIKQAQIYRQQDNLMRNKLQARSMLESYTVSVKDTLNSEQLIEKIGMVQIKEAKERVSLVEEWLSSHPNVEVNQIQSQKTFLQNFIDTIVGQAHHLSSQKQNNKTFNQYQLAPTFEEID